MKQDNCWYLEVCNNNECSNCIRYTEMQFLLHNSGIPKDKQRPISLYAPKEDYNAYKQLSIIKDEIVDFVEQGGSLYIAVLKARSDKGTFISVLKGREGGKLKG